MTHVPVIAIEQTLQEFVPAKEIRTKALELGVVKRLRKVDACVLALTLILFVSTRDGRSVAGLRRAFALHAGVLLSRSSFAARFSRTLEELLDWLLTRIIEKSRKDVLPVRKAVGGFDDIIAVDSSVAKVADALRSVWKGTRNNSAAAALKVHTFIRALTGELLRYRLTAESYGDSRGFGVGPWIRNCLMLMDMGYSSPSLWRRVASHGGFFITRLPADRDPVITSENRRHRGRARKLTGENLREALRNCKRTVVDVNCRFRARVRGYKGGKGKYREVEFRVVAMLDPKTKEYHLYVTNVPIARLVGEQVGAMYALRWEVELFYKAAKSGSALAELPTANQVVVRIMVKAALIRTALAMVAKRRLEEALPESVRVNPLAWMKIWNEIGSALLRDLLRTTWSPIAPDVTWARLLDDPNPGRAVLRQVVSSGDGYRLECWFFA